MHTQQTEDEAEVTGPETPDEGPPPREAVQRDDTRCWCCGGATVYQQCKLVCTTCHFTRDCSDP
jgi:hypothetical protein